MTTTNINTYNTGSCSSNENENDIY
jgi:hypothetical protein